MPTDPSEKYRDKVSPEHRMSMEAIGFAYQLLKQHREQFDKLIKAERDMHNFGGMLDPTLYRDMIYSESFKQQMRLVKATVGFLDQIGVIDAEIEKKVA